MIKFERGRTIFKRCNERQRQTLCDLANVDVFYITSICIHGRELLRKFTFHQKYRKRSHNETDVRHIWEIDNRTIIRDLWSEYNYLGRLFMWIFIFSWWWRSHQSLAHEGLRTFRSCIMLWKDEREPTIKSCMEDKLTWFKSSPEYRALDTIDGEPMEFDWTMFPGFTTLQLCSKVQELMSRLSVTPEEFTGRIIFMSMFNDISAQFVSLCAKRFSPGKWSFFGPGSEKKWCSNLHWQTPRRMGQSRRADDVDICRKQTPNLLIHESIIQRSAQEQRW